MLFSSFASISLLCRVIIVIKTTWIEVEKLTENVLAKRVSRSQNGKTGKAADVKDNIMSKHNLILVQWPTNGFVLK